jgi:hypothetical protein
MAHRSTLLGLTLIILTNARTVRATRLDRADHFVDRGSGTTMPNQAGKGPRCV